MRVEVRCRDCGWTGRIDYHDPPEFRYGHGGRRLITDPPEAERHRCAHCGGTLDPTLRGVATMDRQRRAR